MVFRRIQGVDLRKSQDGSGRNLDELARESGVHPATLGRWIQAFRAGTLALDGGDGIQPSHRHPGEKLALLLESKTIGPDGMDDWLRKRRLHFEHLPLWEEELTTEAERREILEYVDEAKAAKVSERSLCRLIGLNRRTLHNWRRQGLRDRRKGSARHVAHRLSPEEEAQCLSTANSLRFADKTPDQIVAELAQEGRYIASPSTFYRILRRHSALAHRRESRKPRSPLKPERIAVIGPNQVWAWDITWLKTDVTPQQRRTGEATLIYEARNRTIAVARLRNPLRWRCQKTKRYDALPVKAYYSSVSRSA